MTLDAPKKNTEAKPPMERTMSEKDPPWVPSCMIPSAGNENPLCQIAQWAFVPDEVHAMSGMMCRS